YSTMSRGEWGIPEIPHASRGHLAAELGQLDNIRPGQRVLIAHHYRTLAGLQLLHLHGVEVNVPARAYAYRTTSVLAHPLRRFHTSKTLATALSLFGALEAHSPEYEVDLRDPAAPAAKDRFVLNTLGRSDQGQPDYDLIVTTHRDLNIVNRRRLPR